MGQTALDIPQWHSCSKDKDDSLWSMASMVNYWIWGCRIFAWVFGERNKSKEKHVFKDGST